jgi:hypothetical protein
MRLPPPFTTHRLHPEDPPLPNMRDYARNQSMLIVEAATHKPQPHAILTVGGGILLPAATCSRAAALPAAPCWLAGCWPASSPAVSGTRAEHGWRLRRMPSSWGAQRQSSTARRCGRAPSQGSWHWPCCCGSPALRPL